MLDSRITYPRGSIKFSMTYLKRNLAKCWLPSLNLTTSSRHVPFLTRLPYVIIFVGSRVVGQTAPPPAEARFASAPNWRVEHALRAAVVTRFFQLPNSAYTQRVPPRTGHPKLSTPPVLLPSLPTAPCSRYAAQEAVGKILNALVENAKVLDER